MSSQVRINIQCFQHHLNRVLPAIIVLCRVLGACEGAMSPPGRLTAPEAVGHACNQHTEDEICAYKGKDAETQEGLALTFWNWVSQKRWHLRGS